MVIHLTYQRLRIKANVIYSFSAIKNIVMVSLEKELPGIEKDLLLINGDAGWKEANELQSYDPDLFNQILSRLDTILQRCSTLLHTVTNMIFGTCEHSLLVALPKPRQCSRPER